MSIVPSSPSLWRLFRYAGLHLHVLAHASVCLCVLSVCVVCVSVCVCLSVFVVWLATQLAVMPLEPFHNWAGALMASNRIY